MLKSFFSTLPAITSSLAEYSGLYQLSSKQVFQPITKIALSAIVTVGFFGYALHWMNVSFAKKTAPNKKAIESFIEHLVWKDLYCLEEFSVWNFLPIVPRVSRLVVDGKPLIMDRVTIDLFKNTLKQKKQKIIENFFHLDEVYQVNNPLERLAAYRSLEIIFQDVNDKAAFEQRYATTLVSVIMDMEECNDNWRSFYSSLIYY